ncbi:Hermansky-Pudlak syndrome 5 protein [Apis mellifera caucasica]|nr:Hermansky-Pudlak syndrome 5 protein [Apis mellifera caucasica]
MQEYPYVLSEYEEINPLLYKPINSTQRIKYTCFNVSSNYILLGSTSGSIYLFSRKPCSFIQLIPLSEGIVSRILISPDEKTIALTTVRGIVCLVVLKPTPKLIAISTEHIHKQINCLCWNDNSSEIYIGDENGKISVLVLSIFTVNDGKHWSLVASYAKEIQQGQCLFCGKSIKKENHEELINWTAVIYEIMKKQGPDIAMTLLMKLEKAIPNISIDRSIFQSLIFTKLLYQHGMKYTINFNKHNLESSKYNTICSTKIRDQLVGVLEKDLNKSINRNIFENGAHHWGMYYQNKLSTCSCCTLSLQTPVLLGNNGIAIFDCGHAYHVNCMIEKKLTACNLHS